MLDDLVTRLRQHEGGARQQCLCRSTQENCLRCECGLAADAIELLHEDLSRRTAAHPLVMDATTGMARFATQEDIHDFEFIAHKYERLLAVLRAAI